MRLILTRHGQTEGNIKDIIQGHMQGVLSPLGIKQAKKLAIRLKDKKIDAIYSSDLARAADTAKEIARYHPHIGIYYVKELREADFGKLTGKSAKEIDWSRRPAEIESHKSMRKRVKGLLDRVYEKYPDKTVIFVGHNGICNELIRIILKKPNDFKFDRLHNTAVNIFEIKEDENHVVHLLNCKNHLD